MSDPAPRDHTVVIADDHPLFRRGLREAIHAAPGFQVAAEAGDGETAIRHLQVFRPAVAVVDLAMPQRDGFAVAAWAAEHQPDCRVVIMTMYKDEAYLQRALELGAAGFMVKDDAHDDLLRCLETVVQGEFYLSPSIGTPAVPAPKPQPDEATLDAIGRLTPQQRQVLRHLADYKTSKEIARILELSPKTVENHRSNISAALDLHGTNSLLRFAVRHRDLL